MRFSLKTLMLAVLVISAFLAGRISVQRPSPTAPATGTWLLTTPGGVTWRVKLRREPDGRYALGNPNSTSSNLSGFYVWDQGRLVMDDPADDRMMGMEWEWVGNSLMLTRETANTPAGATYLGCQLFFFDSNTEGPDMQKKPRG